MSVSFCACVSLFVRVRPCQCLCLLVGVSLSVCFWFVAEAGSVEPSWTLAHRPSEASKITCGCGATACVQVAYLTLQFGWIPVKRIACLQVRPGSLFFGLRSLSLRDSFAFLLSKPPSTRVVLKFQIARLDIFYDSLAFCPLESCLIVRPVSLMSVFSTYCWQRKPGVRI